MSHAVVIKKAVKKYGNFTALNGVDLEIKPGEFFTLLGPSGCGKTTLLRMIAGFNSVDGGEICFDEKVINNLEAHKRDIGMVFQNYAIFPHLTVKKNVAFGLQNRKLPKDQIEERTQKFLGLMKIEEYQDRLPERLSGGQQQRVGVARALAANPQVLLMDEPFGALDPVTRGALQAEMTRIHRILGRTIVLVTHDIDEALRLADHLVLMDHGEVVQQGSPLELLTWPKNDFVREFFGRSELGVRLLSLRTVSDYMRREAAPVSGEPLQAQMSLRDALSAFVARQCEVLPVSDARGAPCGTLHFRDLLAGEVTREGTA